MNLEVTVGRVRLKNPVMNASGCFGLEYGSISGFDLKALGAIIPKSVKPQSVAGNPPPRICEVYAGMINSIGLEGPGIDRFIAEELPKYLSVGIPVVVSIAGGREEDYLIQAEKLDKTNAAGIEVNVSCPNVDTGLTFGTKPDLTYDLTKKIRSATNLPLWVKLTPNVGAGEMIAIAKKAYEAGADALVIANTLRGMKINIEKQKPELPRKFGGVSGPAIMSTNLAFVYDAYAALSDKIQIIGVGGIMDADGALQYILGGASAVQIGTANFVDPFTMPKIINGVSDYMERKKVEDIKELIGKAHR